MVIALNHTIIPARDKEAAARQFAELLGLAYEVSADISHRKVNDTLTFLFDDTTRSMSRTPLHAGRRSRLRSSPWSVDDGKLNDWGGREGRLLPDG
jgi:hypothetical protein